MFNLMFYDEYHLERYADFKEFLEITNLYGLKTVPIIEVGESFHYSLEDLIKLADGFSAVNSNCLREGIVIRPKIAQYSPILHRNLSFKVISNEYLLKHGI